MATDEEHPLTGPRVGAAVGLLGLLGVGLALMEIAYPHLNPLFWIGFAISMMGGVGEVWLGISEIKRRRLVSGVLIFVISAVGFFADSCFPSNSPRHPDTFIRSG